MTTLKLRGLCPLERLMIGLGLPAKGCWEWSRATFYRGYGHIGLTVGPKKRKDVQTHRLMYELAFGPIPAGLLVLHECDNPPCCRPSHLKLGTHGVNLGDMTARGRRVNSPHPGEANYFHKLTEAQVLAIRSTPKTYGSERRLAKEYSVTATCIHLIRSGKTWRHLL